MSFTLKLYHLHFNVFYLECQVEETELPVNQEQSAVSPTTVLPPAKRPKLCLPPVYKYSASPISSPQVRKPGELVTVREDRGSGSTSETNQGMICEIWNLKASFLTYDYKSLYIFPASKSWSFVSHLTRMWSD